MRKVKFEWNEHLSSVNINADEVYDVISYVVSTNGDIMIEIIDDVEYKRTFSRYNKYSAIRSVFIFSDVTSEYRESVIDGILK